MLCQEESRTNRWQDKILSVVDKESFGISFPRVSSCAWSVKSVSYQSMIFAMSCISLLGSVVWGHHMYTVGLETDTRAYFTGVTILISLPTGTKIFNWLSTYLGNPPLLQLKASSPFFGLLFLLMFTIGGSTGITIPTKQHLAC